MKSVYTSQSEAEREQPIQKQHIIERNKARRKKRRRSQSTLVEFKALQQNGNESGAS